jgi:hydroxymethylpyrimidine pyrophosphatase-like HAD family hydrolase
VYKVLATDFDGTIAEEGIVAPGTEEALRSFRENGGRIVMVTGRELAELFALPVPLDLFDYIVGENGAVIYDVPSGTSTPLAKGPPDDFYEDLVARGATPLSRGISIVATREPYETLVLDLIRDRGLELQVIFNKGAVMILPSGVNKATGLAAALERLSMEPDVVIGVGDGENDHALLDFCGLGVAVANAVPSLRERADWVTPGVAGQGVMELVEAWLAGNLNAAAAKV